VPKPGEYVVVTADKKIDRTRVLDIPIMDLLDVMGVYEELCWLKLVNREQNLFQN